MLYPDDWELDDPNDELKKECEETIAEYEKICNVMTARGETPPEFDQWYYNDMSEEEMDAMWQTQFEDEERLQ